MALRPQFSHSRQQRIVGSPTGVDSATRCYIWTNIQFEVAGAKVIMTKAGIIETTLREMRPMSLENEPPFGDEPDYADIISELQRRLPEGADIRDLPGFPAPEVECRDTCHHFYPHL